MSPTRKNEVEIFSSHLFHDILNPLTVVSLELETQNKKVPVLQEHVEKVIHKLTHLEHFVSLLCQHIKPTRLFRTFSVNSEIEQCLSIVDYTARKTSTQIVTFLLDNIVLFGNHFKFHQALITLFQHFFTHYQKSEQRKIEIYLEKRKNFCFLSFYLYNIDYTLEKRNEVYRIFHYEFNGDINVRKTQKRVEVTLKFPLKEISP